MANLVLSSEEYLIVNARHWSNDKGQKKAIIEVYNPRGEGKKITIWSENPQFVNHDNISAIVGAKVRSDFVILT